MSLRGSEGSDISKIANIPTTDSPLLEGIGLSITSVRGQRLILDAELAALYAVESCDAATAVVDAEGILAGAVFMKSMTPGIVQ